MEDVRARKISLRRCVGVSIILYVRLSLIQTLVTDGMKSTTMVPSSTSSKSLERSKTTVPVTSPSSKTLTRTFMSSITSFTPPFATNATAPQRSETAVQILVQRPGYSSEPSQAVLVVLSPSSRSSPYPSYGFGNGRKSRASTKLPYTSRRTTPTATLPHPHQR